MKHFAYVRPSSVDEALKLLKEEKTNLLAGGTDLLTLMKADIAAPARLVDIKRLEDVPKGIEETDEGITLGALTTLTDIEMNPLIRERYPLLSEAAGLAATPQLRNMATLAGNLLQRPRCWYFRNSHLDCWLKGGDTCPAYDGQNQLHALFGGGPCYAVHPSDLAATLLALEAEVILQGSKGKRMLPLHDFFALPEDDRRTETTIGNDLLLSIHLPPLSPNTRSVYLKAMDRKIWAFALVGVAAVMRLENGRVEHTRLVLSGVAPVPWRVRAAEQELIGNKVSEALFAHAAQVALADAAPLAHNAYKVPLAQNLIQRALATLAERH